MYWRIVVMAHLGMTASICHDLITSLWPAVLGMTVVLVRYMASVHGQWLPYSNIPVHTRTVTYPVHTRYTVPYPVHTRITVPSGLHGPSLAYMDPVWPKWT